MKRIVWGIFLFLFLMIVGRVEAKMPIMGTFIAFSWGEASYYNTKEKVVSQFDNMDKLGMKTIIVIGPLSIDVEREGARNDYSQQLEYVFDEAEKRNYQVYVAPVEYGNWYKTQAKTDEMVNLTKSEAVKVLNKFKSYKSFVGWYIAPEYTLNTGTGFEMWTNINRHFKQIAPDKKTMTAPYYLAPCYPGRYRCENQWWPNRTPQQMADNAKKLMGRYGN